MRGSRRARRSSRSGRTSSRRDYKKALAAVLDELLPEAFATVREACRRLLGTTVMVTGHELTWDMVPYDVQLIGGIVLHHGRIAEMATGEGKTLVATLPLYLNALAGRGAHLVTVNDYLARRDSQWMGHVYKYLGLTVGCIDDTEPSSPGAARRLPLRHHLRHQQRVRLRLPARQHGGLAGAAGPARARLRHRRRSGLDPDRRGAHAAHHHRPGGQRRRREVHHVQPPGGRAGPQADRAGQPAAWPRPRRCSPTRRRSRTAAVKLFQAQLGMPKNKQLLKLLNETGVKQLVQRAELDYIADRKLPIRQQQMRGLEDVALLRARREGPPVHLTDRAPRRSRPTIPTLFVVPDISEAVAPDRARSRASACRRSARRGSRSRREYAAKSEKLHIIHQLLQAYSLYEKDVEYVVQDGKVMIVDEFTGRLMPGRRWSDGLHQAVEAKEGVQIKGETQTLATITIQNYFRMYDKLAGMTGTAETEETEFH